MKVQLAIGHNGKWINVGLPLGADNPTASISDSGEQRQVFIFGYYDGGPGVWRSDYGMDVEDDQYRVVSSLQLTKLSDLSEPYELALPGRGATARFTLVED